jgi:predicted dinucleotide-binding enzyme
MDITIAGSGRVGSALASAFTRLGHPVTLAVRDPADGRSRVAPARAVPGAGAGADLVVLAVPFGAVASVVAALGPPDGGVLVDATNPFGAPLPAGHASGAAHVAALAPGVRVVKAFNVLGAEHLAEPAFAGGGRALLPVAGDDAGARALVRDLAADVGFEAVEVGSLDNAHLLEEAARYWGLLAVAGGLGRRFALGALRRAP